MLIRRTVAVLVLSVVIAAGLPAQEANRRRIIPVDDPAYTYLDLVYLEAGLPQASSFRPYTAQEFDEYIRGIPEHGLSPRGRQMLALLRQRLMPTMMVNRGGGLGFAAGIETSIEYYAKHEQESDYVFSRGDRLPMLSAPLELWFFDSVYANATLTLEEDYRLTAGRWEEITYTRSEAAPAPVHQNHLNWFSPQSNLLELDWYFPFRALISAGGPHWYFTYGRHGLDVGNGVTGNLLLSDYPDYYDLAILSTHWEFFKGTAAYIYFEPWLTAADRQRLESGEYYTRIRDYGLPYKALMLHHLEFRPLVMFPQLPQVLLFASEAIMFGTQYPQIRDFNPFMIFHNWFEYERTNDSFLLGINVVPTPRVELYGEYFLNEFDTSYEDGGNFPGASGLLGGVRGMYAAPFGVLSGYAEFVHTDPLLYHRYHPLLTFVSRRRIWSYIEPDQMIYVDKPIGYYAGPDTRVLSTGMTYRLPPELEATVAYSYITQGQKNLRSPYQETPGEETPTGVPWRTHLVELQAGYSPVPAVTLGGSLYLVSDTNVEHQPGVTRSDFQGAVHITLRAGATP